MGDNAADAKTIAKEAASSKSFSNSKAKKCQEEFMEAMRLEPWSLIPAISPSGWVMQVKIAPKVKFPLWLAKVMLQTLPKLKKWTSMEKLLIRPTFLRRNITS